MAECEHSEAPSRSTQDIILITAGSWPKGKARKTGNNASSVKVSREISSTTKLHFRTWMGDGSSVSCLKSTVPYTAPGLAELAICWLSCLRCCHVLRKHDGTLTEFHIIICTRVKYVAAIACVGGAAMTSASSPLGLASRRGFPSLDLSTMRLCTENRAGREARERMESGGAGAGASNATQSLLPPITWTPPACKVQQFCALLCTALWSTSFVL